MKKEKKKGLFGLQLLSQWGRLVNKGWTQEATGRSSSKGTENGGNHNRKIQNQGGKMQGPRKNRKLPCWNMLLKNKSTVIRQAKWKIPSRSEEWLAVLPECWTHFLNIYTPFFHLIFLSEPEHKYYYSPLDQEVVKQRFRLT